MKKTYTRPEIEVSKFEVETVVTTSIGAADLTAGIYTDSTTHQAVEVVSFTKIFAKEG